MGFDPIVTGDRRRAAVHRMKIPFCRRSRLQEIRFRPASGSERQASAPLSNLDSSGLVETLVLAHSSKTDRGNLAYRVGIDKCLKKLNRSVHSKVTNKTPAQMTLIAN